MGKVYSLDHYRINKKLECKEGLWPVKITNQQELENHFRSIEQIKIEEKSGQVLYFGESD